MAGRRVPHSWAGSAGIGWARTRRPRGAGLCLRAPAPRRWHCRAKRTKFRVSWADSSDSTHEEAP
eukprot:1523758-Alexandrium_andersonii.AAC.1